jgi:hypothetical protein
MKKNLLLILFLFALTTSFSQITYEKRIEFELKDGYDNEKIYDFGENGLLVRSVGRDVVGGEIEWKYELFNTDLKSVNTQKVMLSKKLYSDETFTTENSNHTFFRDKYGNFLLLSVDAENFKITKVEGKISKKTWVADMAILGDYAFFSARIKNAPYLFSVNWKTGKQKFIPVRIPGINPKKITLNNFQLLPNSDEIFVFLDAKISKKVYELFIVRLNTNGDKKDLFNFSKNIDNNIVSISACNIGDGKYIFTGTYSSKYTSLSEGLFFCQGGKGKIDYINYYNFTELENFLTYLPERRQARLEKKKAKKQAKGKEFKINYYIADHDVIVLNDGYLFLGEAYYPTYRTETYTTTSTVNGVTTTQTHTRTVFDGYQYTHAVIAKFDESGKMQWDRTFEMWPAYKPYFVKRFISVAEKSSTSIKMVFASSSKIVSKEFSFGGKVLQESETEEIETGVSGDKTKRSFSNIDYWYKNYFIAYGSQVIKNKANKKVDRKRKVYFISKIRF